MNNNYKLVVIILVFLVVSLVGYIVYDKIVLKEEDKTQISEESCKEYINNAFNPVSVPVAAKTILPNTIITSDMIAYVTIPGSTVSDLVHKNEDYIIGNYTDNTIIPKGSLFYKEVLVR